VYAAAGNALLDDTGVDGAQFIEAACHRSVEASVQPGPSLLDIQAGRLVLVDQSAKRSLMFDPLAKPLPQQLLVRGQPFLDDRNGLGQLVLLPPSTALSIMLATSPPGPVPSCRNRKIASVSATLSLARRVIGGGTTSGCGSGGSSEGECGRDRGAGWRVPVDVASPDR
jgi:hypothetical protein